MAKKKKGKRAVGKKVSKKTKKPKSRTVKKKVQSRADVKKEFDVFAKKSC